MKIAVLSDIHGNYIALQKCVKYALDREIHTFVFLGDYIGEMAYPQRTMEMLYEIKEKYKCYFIKGNKEEYWESYRNAGETGWKKKDSTTGALYYAYHNLNEVDLAFFRDLPISGEICYEDLPKITICHGSPDRASAKMLSNDEATFIKMKKDPNRYILCGHTHVQEKIQHDGKVVLNCGSVGASIYSNGKTQFMILNGEEHSWKEEFVSLEYDVESVIEELHISKLTEMAPCWSIVTEQLLRTGDIAHGTVLQKAMELCKEELGKCDWPNIPEKFWEAAVVHYFPQYSEKIQYNSGVIAQDDHILIRKMEGNDEDYAIFLKWMTDPETMKYWDGLTVQFTYEKVAEKYKEHVEENITQCIIEYKEKPIGYCQYYIMDETNADVPVDKFQLFAAADDIVYGIDLFLGEVDYRNQGIGTACLKLLTGTLFEVYGADALMIDPKVHNLRAIRCYQKVGFQDLFVIPQRELQDGIYHDSLIMGMKKPNGV